MSDDDLSPPEKLYAGIQMTRPLLRNITARVEADLTGTGVSVGQRAILEVLLALGPATAPEITKKMDVTRQFVGRELKELLASGLVKAKENPNHRTSKFYGLTPESRAIIHAIRKRESATIASFSEQFSEEEIAAFYKVLSALNAEMSKQNPEG